MKRLYVTIVLGAAFLTAPIVVRAAEYYVDRNHPSANDTNPGTEAQPFKSIQRGVDAAQPGDTVIIKGSLDPNSPEAVYNVTGNGITTIRPGGTGNPITIASFTGHTVIIEGDGGDHGINLDNASYHIFRGLTVRNFNKAAEGFAAKTGIVIENCEFSQTYETGLRFRNVNNLIMRDCYVHHCFETGILVRESDNILFEHVKSSYNNDGRGADGDADGFATSGCGTVTFIDCEARDNGEDGFDLNNNGTLINCMANGHNACNVKLWRRDVDGYTMKTTTIINSVFSGATEAGIKISQGAQMRLYNSVVYGNGEEGIAFRGIKITEGPAVVTSRIANTIIAENGWGGIEVLQSGPNVNDVNADHNLYFNNCKANLGLSSDTDAVNDQDPLFFGAQSNNFHVREGSPAIDQGVTLPEVTIDLDGQARPFGPLPDIGADERIVVSGNTAPSFTAPAQTNYEVSEGERVRIDFDAVDPEGHRIVFYIMGGDVDPAISLDEDTGIFTFQTTAEHGGDAQTPLKTYTLDIGVTDEYYVYPPDKKQITITVHNVNRAPVYSGLEEYTLIKGRQFRIKLPIADPDGGTTVTASLANQPGSASYNSSNYIIDWIPSSAEVGTHNSVLHLSDGTDSADYTVSFRVMDDAPYREPADENNIFYADNSNGDDNNDGQTPASAWKTIQKAKNTLTAGQMVLIKGGTYNEYGSVAYSGSPGSPIIFKAYPGETVVMDGTEFGSPEAFNFNSGVSYIVVDGLTLFNFGETIYFRGSNSDITLLNITITKARDYGIYGGNSSNIRIENVVIDEVGDRGINFNGTNIHIYNSAVYKTVYLGFAFSSTANDNINIVNSRVTDALDGAQYGVLAYGKNVRIAGCKFLNNAGIGIDIRDAEYAYIENTVIAGTRLRSGNAYNLLIGTGCEFEMYNSVLSNSLQYGLYIPDSFNKSHSLQNCIIYNNPTNVRIPAGLSLHEDYNIFGTGFTPKGGRSFIADPLFKDPQNNDFSLQGNSPAIDKGTDTGVYCDIQGNMRPHDGDRNGSAEWDIGAYEYGSAPADPDSDQEPDPEPDAEPEVVIPAETALHVMNNIIKSAGNQSAVIRCDMKEQDKLTVKIYDAKGKEIITVCDEQRQAGRHEFIWTGQDLSGRVVGSGIYLVHMKSGNYTETKKIAIIR